MRPCAGCSQNEWPNMTASAAHSLSRSKLLPSLSSMDELRAAEQVMPPEGGH